MRCDNHFCVYWSNNCCTLQEITLDIIGSCTNCVPVDLKKRVQKEKRENALKQFKKEQ